MVCSGLASAASGAAATFASGSAFAGFSALAPFFGVVADLVSARPRAAFASASYTSVLLCLLGATSSGGGAGRFLNFCQSPVFSRMRCTGSDGWAPTESQYCTRSDLTSITEGCSFGW